MFSTLLSFIHRIKGRCSKSQAGVFSHQTGLRTKLSAAAGLGRRS
ncbi:hypothetical protein CPter91_2864 [Collimonas pratensis]|uniref:Uncharacterized protein n=1 Tax=Collimonas pratensis TaxID=279113 RepID=A0A127Q575_9BURK|nr:hypothetical protein CPter91_2864 [Collimonas pratensis]